MKPQKSRIKSFVKVKPWKEVEDEPHIFYDSLLVYWFVLKLLGLVPFTKNKNGEVKLKYFSWSSLYCLIAYSLMVYPTIMSISSLLKDFSNPENNFEDMVFSGTLLLIHLTHFLLPWSHWLELKTIENVFGKWKEFQAHYKNLTGETMPHLKRKFIVVRMLIIFTITLAGTFMVFSFGVKNDFFYEFSAMFYLSIVLQIHFSLFMANSHLLILIISSFKKNFRKVVIGKGKYSLMAKYNALWIDLADLTESVGGILYKMYGLLIFGYFINLTLNGFSILQYVNGFTIKRLATTIVWFLIAFFFFVTCHIGERISKEVGESFVDELIDYKIQSQNERFIDEIEMFIDSIQVTPHKVCYQGYVKVDHALFISMLSTIITYLVVVIQFSS